MPTHSPNIWWIRFSTLLLAALAAASATYWTLKWSGPQPSSLGAEGGSVGVSPADTMAVARALGGGGATALPQPTGLVSHSQFKLLGVMATPQHRGVALISINDQPAKHYPIGAPVSDHLVLHSVAQRSASLANALDAPVTQVLELPALSAP